MDMCGKSFPLGSGRWLLQLPVAAAGELPNAPSVAFHICLDNSASMGPSSQQARDCFGQLLKHATAPCSFTVFDTKATVLGSSLRTPEEVCDLRLPPQGRTDISAGVRRSLELIIEQEKTEPGANHHVLFLLSDGAHNEGQPPAQAFPKLAQGIKTSAPQLRLSVVVVGITGSSRTCDGMLGRAVLETVPLEGLAPIYFADRASDMLRVLGELEIGVGRLAGGRVAHIELPATEHGCGFIRAPGDQPVGSVETFVSDGTAFVSFVVQAEMPPQTVLIDGRELCVNEGPFDEHAAVTAVETLISIVRQRRIGSHNFDGEAALAFLNPCIKAIADYQEVCISPVDAGKGKRGPAMRLHQHKALSSALHQARHLRNQLAEAVAFVSNDSAEQAKFLTGSSQKYASKALRRAAVVQADRKGFNVYLDAVARTSCEIKVALRRDVLRHITNLKPHQRESMATTLSGTDSSTLRSVFDQPCLVDPLSCDVSVAALLDSGELLAAMKNEMGSEAPMSYISLLSQWEQLSEWVIYAGDVDKIRAAGVSTEYELLMYVGMLGFPIKVGRSAATQMDPFQLSISSVYASPADTASLCCALQSEQTISAPEGGEVQDLLLLVDPDCPDASRAALSCTLFDMYTSVVLCRDLHMYTGIQMRVALHAHSLFALIKNDVLTEADLDIALRICYSVRKIWEHHPSLQQEYERLFCRLKDWDELTAADGIHDPSQLLLVLVALCDKEDSTHALAPPAILMLFNEVLSRKAKQRFKSMAGGEASKSRLLAVTCVRGFLGVTDDSAPTAQAIDQPEPSREEVEASCRKDVTLDRGSFDFQDWSLKALTPFLRACAFASALRDTLQCRSGGWDQLAADMEMGRRAYSDVLSGLQNCILAQQLPDACDFAPEALENVLAAMTAQAMLNTSSDQRRGLPDVRVANTLSQIAVSLRMDTYSGHVATKMSDWRCVALDVTAARARAADIGQFEGMLGSHAHGLTKEAFWGLWEAAKHDGYGGQKVQAFIQKANHGFCQKYLP